jgi:hypothetical protein
MQKSYLKGEVFLNDDFWDLLGYHGKIIRPEGALTVQQLIPHLSFREKEKVKKCAKLVCKFKIMYYLCSPFFCEETVYSFDVKMIMLYKRSKKAEFASFDSKETGTPKQK